MDANKSEKKEKQPSKAVNGPDSDALRKDEAFWASKVKSLAKALISENRDDCAENNDKFVAMYPEKVFSVHCKRNDCECLTFRKLITGIYVENEFFGDLWEKAKEIISSYYTLLPKEQDSIINRKYQELLKKSCGIRWFSDGSVDVKNNVHVNYFSLSTEMTFIIIFNLLILRDRSQLYELLCLQLTSVILAYREGIKEMTRCIDADQVYYEPEEFLNYILDGYDRLLSDSSNFTPLVIEMRDHLQKFSLSWELVNSIFYRRFLYVDIESRMADCILRLKDAVTPEKYKAYVYRFIKFDEEMTQIGKVWDVAQQAVESHRNSQERMASVERTKLIRQIIESLQNLKDVPDDVMVDEKALALNWFISSEKEEVWMGVLNGIKKKEQYKRASLCQCWSCHLIGGNTVPETCVILDDSPLQMNEPEDELHREYYHLGFAVFKHAEREPYTRPTIRPDLFCVFNDPPCDQMLCQVATNLVIGSYPLSFTKFLLRTYQPLSMNDREKFLKVPSQSLIRKFCLRKAGAAAKEIMQEADEINHSFLLLSLFWDEDDIADPMRSGLASALAENFKIDVKFSHKGIIISYFHALFRISGFDIVMDMDWLEKINLANLFKGFGVHSNTIHDSTSPINNSSNTVEAIEMTLNELKLTSGVSVGSNALDLVQISMKEVAEKLSSISLADENSENAKQVLENEIKKPLVEALKLAASNKKLEAELKSLQKEHNMLKDMVKGLEQIHGDKKEVPATVTSVTTTDSVSTEGNVTKCEHTHSHHSHSQSGSLSPSISEIDHGKDSGSGADCVCYYCTLFGKNQDLISNRSTETRRNDCVDRLRKRLHNLQNQKDFSSKTKNLKNIGMLLKNRPATSSAAVTTSKSVEPTPYKCPSDGLPSSLASVKMKIEPELEKRKIGRKNVVKQINTSKSSHVQIQRETAINVKSLENMIEYIEGPTSKAVVEQKKADDIAVKKQQKKARQIELKMRRQIDLNFETLSKINVELQETIIDAKQVQNQLSQLKSGKGKNKELNKVKVAEDKFSELTSIQTKLEHEAKALLNGIKTMNPNIDVYQRCTAMKSVMRLLATPPESFQLKQQPVQVQIKQRSVQAQGQEMPLSPLHMQSKSNDDPSKRMVTIRRINLPHAEPQVTVTAKGTTPDMDQLLYTFVNGQMVPASSLSPSAFQNGSIQLFMSSNGQTKMVVENNLQRRQPKQEKREKKDGHVSPFKVTNLQSQASEKNKRKCAPESTEKVKNGKKQDNSRENPEEPSSAMKNKGRKTDAKTVTKKARKAYIDPEFSANPFKLLDDEEEQISESEESLPESLVTFFEPERGQAAGQQQSYKLGKIAHKKNIPLRKESITSVASSNIPKDPKKSKTNQTVLEQTRPVPSSQEMMSPQLSKLTTSSIMDQLNRGVRVEGLRLPPGITLTKVAASEAIAVNRESINRIAQPMQEYTPHIEKMIPQVKSKNMAQNNSHSQKTPSNNPAENYGGKKKNKKKKAKAEFSDSAAACQQQHNEERIVTLKNPMFHNSSKPNLDTSMHTPAFMSPNVSSDAHGASITRNENGMYTIRNPSFQSTFGCDTPSPVFLSRELQGQQGALPNQASPFPAFKQVEPPIEPQQSRCSVIGSEMKTALKRRQEQEFNSGMEGYNQYGMRTSLPTYSHFGGSSVNFSNNGTQCEDGFQSDPTPMISYEDLRLKPGQMLNPEVTVLNVTQSKIFQSQAKKAPPPFSPIGTPRNGKSESVANMFNDLLITHTSVPTETNGNDKRFDFKHVPSENHIKTDEYRPKIGHNSTNSNSPISVTSLDEIFDNEQKIGLQKTSFFSALQNFMDDDKSSGTSSLFSS